VKHHPAITDCAATAAKESFGGTLLSPPKSSIGGDGEIRPVWGVLGAVAVLRDDGEHLALDRRVDGEPAGPRSRRGGGDRGGGFYSKTLNGRNYFFQRKKFSSLNQTLQFRTTAPNPRPAPPRTPPGPGRARRASSHGGTRMRAIWTSCCCRRCTHADDDTLRRKAAEGGTGGIRGSGTRWRGDPSRERIRRRGGEGTIGIRSCPSSSSNVQ